MVVIVLETEEGGIRYNGTMRAFSIVFGTVAVVAIVAISAFLPQDTEPIVEKSTAPAHQSVEPRATFGDVSLRLEYATTTEAQERGLGGRISIPADYGMLFVFQKDDRYGFWMKDTLVPLDIFWLNDKGQVVSIARSVATSSYPTVFYPTAPARYVLETAAGFADAHLIATGTVLELKDSSDVLQ